MIASHSIEERLNLAFTPTARGIVGLTEQLLTAGSLGGLELERVGDRCVGRWTVNGDFQETELPLPPAAFRTILARIAALCNEKSPSSVSPYGGRAELMIEADPQMVVAVHFVNTADEQKLEISRPEQC